MKKILVAVMAVMMTMGLMAQCPHQKAGCPAAKAEGCQPKKECVNHECLYSPETRAMMQVDRIARFVKDLTDAERQQLLDFYKKQYAACAEAKGALTDADRAECRKRSDAELRKVLGDERYIKYLEMTRPCHKKHNVGRNE